MTNHLSQLLKQAKRVEMSPEEKESQRRSFAFGNANIENSRVTKAMVDQQADLMKRRRVVA